MADQNDRREINPDGADLDGTTEIERQQAEEQKRKIPPDAPVPASDTRGQAETVE
jgi:hypothetical protein